MSDRVDEFIAAPKRALFRLAAPIVVAMFVQTMYNIVDTAFVGALGAEAIAALTFAFPIFFVIISLNAGIGVGINSIISRRLGAKDKDGAEDAAAHGMVITVVFAGITFVLAWFTIKPLFGLLGAQEQVLSLALSYMRIILLSAFFMFPAYATNSIFTAQGDTRTPMLVQSCGLIINAILDPIFIYSLGFGVAGAAIATDIALVFTLFLYIYFLRKKSHVKIRFQSFRFRLRLSQEILRVGAPASLMMLMMSIYAMFLNRYMAHFGTVYVASFGLAMRLESFVIMPIVALSISLLTLAGMFYGARRFDLLKSISWFGIKIAVIFTSAQGLLFYLFPQLFLKIFTREQLLLMIGSAYLRVDVLTFPLMAVSTIISRILQGMGFGVPGLVINLVRIFIVAVPSAYIFVFILGYGFISVAWAMVLGGVASIIVAFWWLTTKFKGLE
ncbi:MAG: MATE family efflux transporter [Acidobacteriota bacterium]